MSGWLRKFVSRKPATALKIITLILISFLFASIAWSSIDKAFAQDNARKSLDFLSSELDEATKRLTVLESTIHDLQNHPNFTSDETKYLKELYIEKLDIEKLKNEFMQVEHKISEGETKEVLAREYYKNDLAAIGNKLANEEFNIGNQYFQIFLAVFTIVGVVSGIALLALERYSSWKIRDAHNRIEKDVLERMRKDSLLTIAESYAHLIMPIWRGYEEKYQSFVENEYTLQASDHDFSSDQDFSELFMHDILLSRRLSEKGLELIRSIYKTERHGAKVKEDWINMIVYFLYHKSDLSRLSHSENTQNDTRTTEVYAKLINHWLYHRTAELVCTKKETLTEISRMIEVSQECLVLSEKFEVGRLWYDLKQTAAFTLLRFASEVELQESGRQVMRDLLAGKTPGPGFDRPPDTWLLDIRKELFPLGVDRYRLDVKSSVHQKPG